MAVTGVSGSGKSTLVDGHPAARRSRGTSSGRACCPGAHDRITGLEHLDKVIDIDQSPIGRTPRSNPATYTGVFTPIRELFAELPEAKIRGYGPGRFSFNVKGGRCEACQGDGLVKIEMHFLPDVYVPCDVCKGKRYNRETLEVRFRGLRHRRRARPHRGGGAARVFENQPRIAQQARPRCDDVGLGYIHLGQSATTLSGGEAQRVKLATELAKRDTGRTLYILDEPTTGLHFEDVRVLLEVLHKLVDRGNTVLVIEHNLDVIKTADWIVDLGPGGRRARRHDRGRPARPEQVAAVPGSFTGAYLGQPARVAPPAVPSTGTPAARRRLITAWSPSSTSSAPSWWGPAPATRPAPAAWACSPAASWATPPIVRCSSCTAPSPAPARGTAPTRRSSAGCMGFRPDDERLRTRSTSWRREGLDYRFEKTTLDDELAPQHGAHHRGARRPEVGHGRLVARRRSRPGHRDRRLSRCT